MCDPVTLALIGTAVATTGVGIYQGQQANNQAKDAAGQSEAASRQTAAKADEAYNAANKKKPNVQGLNSANQQSAATGGASTMLTGPAGVDPNALSLGKNTLLGQ